MGNLLELWELEHLDLHTVQKDGKRFYTNGDEDFHYPSVTTVVGLLNRDHIRLWRERVGEEEAKSYLNWHSSQTWYIIPPSSRRLLKTREGKSPSQTL